MFLWGRRLCHQLGSPIPLTHTGVQAISAGSLHSMVLKQDGSVWTTGWNIYGELGTETKQLNSFTEVVPSGQCGTVVV